MLMTNQQEFKSRIKRVLITEAELQERIKQAGSMLSEEYQGKPLLLVSILKGAFVFLADLCREITIPCEIDFMATKSYYGGTTNCGTVNIVYELEHDISQYHVLIVEDIIDTGITLKDVVKKLKARNPLSLKVITLLDKTDARKVEFEADYTLFEIPNEYVIGYGLDSGEYYRNLPYIAVFDEKR